MGYDSFLQTVRVAYGAPHASENLIDAEHLVALYVRVSGSGCTSLHTVSTLGKHQRFCWI